MKTINYLLCSILLFASSLHNTTHAQQLTHYVDPTIGAGGHGHVFVGASVPFGAVQAGPSNFYKGWDWCSGYNYTDSVIIGFPQLHLSGTGIGDLGDVLIMPYMGEIKLNKGKETERYSGYASRFSHKTETVKPGYYAVKLDDYNIDVELTATERTAYHKYKFPAGKDAHIIIDLQDGINDEATDTYIELADKYTIKGYRSSSGWAKKQQIFFAITSSVPLTHFAVYDDDKPLSGKKGKGKAIKGLITFDNSPGEVSLKVGISPVSSNNALSNIKAEIPEWNFGEIVAQADEKWNKELAKIHIETNNERDKRIFYTSMYHLMIHPSLFNDHNGDYMGSDWKPHKKAGFNNYTIFSLWDTYRAAHPFYILTNPDRTADFINSMLAIFDETGSLPIWHLRGYETGTMVGISSFQVITEAYLKGCTGFDPERAYHALKTTAMSDIRGLSYVRDLKPIPSDSMKNRPVAMAMEIAIGDAGIARMAKAMGKTDDYEYFRKRAENYKLYYDREVGFFRGVMADGSWNPVFDPIKSVRPWAADYAEGNAWQYLWLVPQDVEGLINLLGGEEIFTDRLNTFFSLETNDPDVLVDLTGNIGQYAHGNEPSHHIAYLYAYVGQQWKTAQLVRNIMNEFYHDQPDGLIGNEDCGQMSAWYLFSSLGFYPVFTASNQYVIGSPLFDKSTINLGNGKTFTVEAINNSPKNIYIQQIELNGKPYNHTFITHEDIINGGTLKIKMTDSPNYQLGKDIEYRPRTTPESEYITTPFVHPGMAQNQHDLDYMRNKVAKGEEPWKTAYENLQKNTLLTFTPQPFADISVGANRTNSHGGREFYESARVVYNHALMWNITREKAYAEKAIEILNAWAYTLRSFDDNDAKLSVGLFGYYFLNAAEIIRYTYDGWAEKDTKQFERMVMTVFYPTIKDFFTEANGNWDASMISTMMCIGVFMDNPYIFNHAAERFFRGEGNSGITKYIYPSGQGQEAVRDWDHVQLGIGELAKAVQTAYTQGLDLYSVADNRLAQAFEYTSKFMLGGEIDLYGILSYRRMDKFKDEYESIYHHYRDVKGIALPYTEKVIRERTRPTSSVGFLTAIKAPSKFRPQTLRPLLTNDFIRPTVTGALKEKYTQSPDGSVLVHPGESVQKAIDENKGTGKWIVLTKGVHTLEAPLKIYSGITLAGQGHETILFLNPELRTAALINGENTLQDVVIRDLLIEGAINAVAHDDPNHDRRIRSYMSAPSREGIVFRADKPGGISNLSFENITIQNCTRSGLSLINARNITIHQCDISTNGCSVVPGAGFHHNLQLSHAADITITRSRFDASPWGNGIDILFGKNINIRDNQMARNKLSGIRCSESQNISITGNLTEGNDTNGISLEKLLDGCKNTEVKNNRSANNGMYGIYDESKEAIIKDNQLKNNKIKNQ